MRANRFQSIITFLALLGSVHGGITPLSECSAKAWVRAPNLSPNTIVQGDVRLKISAECPTVETALLGLRFKERSSMEALRSREDANKILGPSSGVAGASHWAFLTLHSANRRNQAVREKMKILANEDLWIVREEERVVFETTQIISVDIEEKAGHDVIQKFFTLVPSTNFPPAATSSYGEPDTGMSVSEFVNVGSRYEYFVRLSFQNGTITEIPAGYTAFQPLYDHPPRHETKIIELERSAPLQGDFKTSSDTSSKAHYTAEISSTSGMVFSEGSKDQAITMVITRTGPAHAFTRPLTVWGCIEPTFSSKWAVEHGMADSQPMQTSKYILRSTREDFSPATHWMPCGSGSGVSVTMPSPTSDQLQANDIVTTSATVTIPIQVERRQISNFETYYQTISSTLVVNLQTPRERDERVDPDDSSIELREFPINWRIRFDEEEEEWVPWSKEAIPEPRPIVSGTWPARSGRIPVVVRPAEAVRSARHCTQASADMSGQVVMSDERGCDQVPLVHYLSDGARGPIFVDGDSVKELLAKSPAERALLAPLLEPVISSTPKGEEFISHRYTGAEGDRPSIYVGETWVKKVAYKDWRQPVGISGSRRRVPLPLQKSPGSQ